MTGIESHGSRARDVPNTTAEALRTPWEGGGIIPTKPDPDNRMVVVARRRVRSSLERGATHFPFYPGCCAACMG